MARLIVAVLALSLLGYLAFRTLYRESDVTPSEREVPTQQLEKVRGAAKRIEDDAQKRLEGVNQKATE